MTSVPSTSVQRTRRLTALSLALPIGLAAALAGCSGEGDETAMPAPAATPSTTALGGKVIDGYITGATVCLDLNGNQTCDADEPSTESGAGGAYSLDTTGLADSAVAGAYVLVSVPGTARDADDGGKTLAEAGKKAFMLYAPVPADAATVGAVVSPLTTLVAQQMISGGLSVTEATQAIRSRLGLPAGAHLHIDYKADTSQPGLAVMANLAAVAMGEFQAAVAAGAPAAATQRQLRLASLNELAHSMGSLLAVLQVAPDSRALLAPAAIQQALQARVSALTADASQPLAVAQGTIASVASTFDSMLASGFGELKEDITCGADGQCTRFTSVHLTLGGSGQWLEEVWRPVYGSGVFSKDTTGQTGAWILEASGWIPLVNSGTYSAQADASVRVTGGSFGSSSPATGRVRMQDLAGLPLSVIGETGPAASRLFPAGALASWWSFVTPFDRYWLQGPVWSAGGEAPASLPAWVGALQTPDDGRMPAATGSWNGVEFTFDGPLASTGTVTYWDLAGGTSLGRGPYALKTLNGQELLVLEPLPAVVLVHTAAHESELLADYGNGKRPLFAVLDGRVHEGEVSLAGTTIDSRPSLNRSGLNALLAARGLCALPAADGSTTCP